MAKWLAPCCLTVYYDGWCPLCVGAKQRIRTWDWLGLMRFVSIRAPGATAHLGVDPALLAQRMYAQTAGGRTVNGIGAIAAIALRVPILLPLWPLLTLSRLLGIGQWLYDQIASRRTIIPVGQCTDGACPIHQPQSDPDRSSQSP